MSASGIVSRNGALDSDQLVSFQTLLGACNQFEGIALPFYLDGDVAGGADATAFVAFAGADLIGFGHLPIDPEPEACLMVHPEHRRRGVGSALAGAMRAELHRRGLPGGLLVADQSSESGRAFLAAINAPYQSSEYRLELDRAQPNQAKPPLPGLSIRLATHADAAILNAIRADAFGDDEHDVHDHISRGLNEIHRRFYLAELDGTPVGMVRAGAFAGIGDITAFGVRRAFQGRGIGRCILLEVIDLLTAQGHDRIAIEVATENAAALGLYESCGFRIVSEYGYYTMTA
jgi:ribosomal protein S18 acetylase RimI-like enzyme